MNAWLKSPPISSKEKSMYDSTLKERETEEKRKRDRGRDPEKGREGESRRKRAR